jgi:hypothetical protein
MGGIVWIELAHDREQAGCVNAVINFRFLQNVEKFLDQLRNCQVLRKDSAP